MNLIKPLSAALLASFLAACSLIPPAQQSSQRQAQIQAQVQTAADPGQKPPEKVTFPNMVKTTPLDTNLPTDKNDQLNAALEQALAEKPAEEGFRVQNQNLPQVFIVRFMAKTQNLKQQVKIPESGAFQLVLEAGSGKKLEILDGDASDGQATLRLPQHSYEALLHLQGPWQPNSSLEVNDELYYVQDTLSSKQGKPIDLNRWLLLGVRPLPVPSDWYSPDGQKLVLKFKTDRVKEFQMAWWTTNQKAAYPPGIKQIGPAGGTVELPGVAKLELPAGALSAPTVVVMRQQKEVASRKKYCPNPYDPNQCYLGWVFAAPIVKFEPLGLKLNKPAPLDLPVYKFFERYSPISIEEVGSLEINNTFSWQYFPYLAKRPHIRKFSDITHHNLIMSLQQFAYISRQMYYTSSVEEFYQSQGFKTQSETSPPCAIKGSAQYALSEHFYLVDNSGKACPESLENIKKYLETGHAALIGRGWEMRPPPLSFQPAGLDESRIPVQFQFNPPRDFLAQVLPLFGPTGQYLGPQINIAINEANPFNDSFSAEVVLHELFHTFQDAYMRDRNDTLKLEERAMIEGTAEFTGLFLTEELKTTFGFTTINPTQSHYAQRVKHLNTLDTSLFLRRDQYNAPLGRDAYDTVAFWTHLFHSYGTQGIAELIHLYGSKHRFQGVLTRSIASLSDLLKQKSGSPTIDDYYVNFVKDAIIQKNVSLFPEIELNHIAFKNTHIISNTHTVQNPLLVSNEGTEPLSVVNLLLQADQKIRQPRNLYIRAISPSPDATLFINPQEGRRKIREFLYPGLVGVNNTEGIAVKTEGDGPTGVIHRKPYISSDFSVSKEGYLMIPSFGHEQPVKSAILSIYNTLWKVAFWDEPRKNAFTMNLEIFLGPKLLSAEWPKEKDGQDITTDKAAPQLDLTGTGFDPSKTEIIFQPRSEVGKEIKQKPVFLESKTDSDGVVIQHMFVNIPNQALKGGWIEARSANIPSNRIEQVTYACNMLPANASFSTAAQKPCPQ